MAGIGDGHCSIGIDAGAKASGKAGRRIEFRDCARRRDGAEQDMVEMVENSTGVVGELVAQGSDEGAGIHSSLQALAADVAHHDEERLVFERQDLEEVSADTVDGQVGALKHEVAGGRQLRRNQQGLDAACGGDFGVGALLLLTDMDESVENHSDEAGEKDRIGDCAGAKLDWSEMKAVVSELLGEPMDAGRVVEDRVG